MNTNPPLSVPTYNEIWMFTHPSLFYLITVKFNKLRVNNYRFRDCT